DAAATPEIYPLSLHDALPIFAAEGCGQGALLAPGVFEEPAAVLPIPVSVVVPLLAPELGLSVPLPAVPLLLPRLELTPPEAPETDRKSTRLNSSHLVISYAVF